MSTTERKAATERWLMAADAVEKLAIELNVVLKRSVTTSRERDQISIKMKTKNSQTQLKDIHELAQEDNDLQIRQKIEYDAYWIVDDMLKKAEKEMIDAKNAIDKGMLIVKSKLICDAIIGVTNFSL